MRLPRLLTAVAVALAVTSAAQAARAVLPAGAKLTRLEVRPARVSLSTPFEYAQLVVTGVLATGERIDATRMATLDAPASVKVSAQGVVRPAADGSGTLTVKL